MDWRDNIRKGSIILTRTGKPRVVRQVYFYNDGRVRSVVLAIRRCSWTHRPVTYLNRHDLKHAGYSLMNGVKWKFSQDADLEFERNIRADVAALTISCCEARSIP